MFLHLGLRDTITCNVAACIHTSLALGNTAQLCHLTLSGFYKACDTFIFSLKLNCIQVEIHNRLDKLFKSSVGFLKYRFLKITQSKAREEYKYKKLKT